jgi:hypothetical protein
VSAGLLAYTALGLEHVSFGVAVDYDPTLQYLFASLGALKGVGYTYVDHPGTPVEVLGSLILVLMQYVSGLDVEDFVVSIVREPEQFLRIADILLCLANLFIVAMMIRWLIPGSSVQQAAFAVACGTAYFALHPMSFATLLLWSHNSFNFIAGGALLLILTLRLRSGQPVRSWQALAIGFAAGALTSVQLYFGAWVVGMTVALMTYTVLLGRPKLLPWLVGTTVLVGSVLGFIVATLPIADEYLVFANFIAKLVRHRDGYGDGPEGLPYSGLLLANTWQLVTAAPVLFVALLFVMVGLVCRLRASRPNVRSEPGRWAIAVGLTMQTVVLLGLIVAKEPNVTYLLSIAATLPVLASCILGGLHGNGRFQVWSAVVTMAIVGAGMVISGTRSATALLDADRRAQSGQATVEAALADLAAQQGERRQDLMVVWSYGTNSRCFARWFADGWRDGPVWAEVAGLCPSDVGPDVFAQSGRAPTAAAGARAGEWSAIVVAEGTGVSSRWLEELGEPVPLDADTGRWGRLLLIRNPRLLPHALR